MAKEKTNKKNEVKYKGAYIEGIKVWIVPLVSLAVCIVVAIIILLPWVEDITDKRKQLDQTKQDQSSLLPKLELLVKQDNEELRNYLLSLNFVVPSSVSPPYVLASLEQAVGSVSLTLDTLQYKGISDVTYTDVRPQSLSSDGGVFVEPKSADSQTDKTATIAEVVEKSQQSGVLQGGNVDVQMVARGEFYQVINFLKTLQGMGPMVVGVDFSIRDISSNQQGEGQPLSKEFSYTGSAPFQNLPSDLGAITTQITGLSEEDKELLKQIESFKPIIPTNEENPDVSPTPSYNRGRSNPF